VSKTARQMREHQSDETFTQAAWDTLRDMELNYDCRAEVTIVLTFRRGVLHCTVEAKSMRPDEAGRRLGAIQGDFPNGRAQTLGTYLFAMANSLSQMVEALRADEWRALTARTGV
jgi:hypothetical protein